MRPRLSSVVLWLAFAAITVAGAVVLLRACGLLLPLVAASPKSGWNFCPATPPALSAEAERGATLARLIRRLERELADKALACASIPPPPPPPFELPTHAGQPRPQQTALLKPPPPPPPKPRPPPPPPQEAKPPPSIAEDRWNNKDLSLLQGCWRLGHDSIGGLTNSNELCNVQAGRICFGDDGRGRREESRTCPSKGYMTCWAPLKAIFGSDGRLHTTQPAGQCDNPNVGYWVGSPNADLGCHRVSDDLVMCTTSGGQQLEFRR